MTNNVRYINLEPNWEGMRRWAESGLRMATTRKDKATFQEILRMCNDATRRANVNATEKALASC